MKKLMIAAATFAAALTSNIGHAETINVTNWSWNPGLVVGDIRNLTPAAPDYLALNNLGIGRFELTGTSSFNMPVDLFSYCIDLYTPMSTGTYTYVTGSTLIPDAARRDLLGTLLSNSAGLLAGASGNQAKVISAATQMAVWEIVYESATTPFNVTGGDFRVGNFQTGPGDTNMAATQSLANTYLSNTTNGQWQSAAGSQLKYLFGNNARQSQVYVAAVPEPATWGMMILGFGLLGGLLRRGYKAIKGQLLLRWTPALPAA
ncbi:PEPxxWA-CTERM sorting domain-containing protein [Sphingomonas aliaeris]|nr:PEPxxWA-CTERM sorting domain-containing protein [Sphingomonas aliaeris]